MIASLETPLAAPAPWHRHLYLQVLAAIVLGVLLGYFSAASGEAMKPLGDGFIKLVKMIIAPVIFLTIVTGISGMRDLGAVGRVALKAFAYFLFFSTLALIIGLIVGNVVQPGAGMNVDVATLDARGGLVGWTELFGQVVAQNAGIRDPWWARVLKASRVDHVACKSVDVEFHTPQKVQVDGEILGKVTALTARVDPGALRVRMSSAAFEVRPDAPGDDPSI